MKYNGEDKKKIYKCMPRKLNEATNPQKTLQHNKKLDVPGQKPKQLFAMFCHQKNVH